MKNKRRERPLGKGECTVTTVSNAPTESWFSLNIISGAQRGTAPRPIGQTAMSDITALHEMCRHSSPQFWVCV